MKILFNEYEQWPAYSVKPWQDLDTLTGFERLESWKEADFPIDGETLQRWLRIQKEHSEMWNEIHKIVESRREVVRRGPPKDW